MDVPLIMPARSVAEMVAGVAREALTIQSRNAAVTAELSRKAGHMSLSPGRGCVRISRPKELIVNSPKATIWTIRPCDPRGLMHVTGPEFARIAALRSRATPPFILCPGDTSLKDQDSTTRCRRHHLKCAHVRATSLGSHRVSRLTCAQASTLVAD